MKISELIEELGEIQAEWGDVPVAIECVVGPTLVKIAPITQIKPVAPTLSNPFVLITNDAK